MTRMLAWVVIPVLNESRHISAVLSQLTENVPQGIAIVVADGGSHDDTIELVKEFSRSHDCVSLIDNPKRLQSAAVNLAASTLAGSAEYLIRCDAHATYPVDFLSRLIETIRATGADSVVVPMDSVGQTCFQKAVAWVSDSLIGSGGSAHRGGRRSGFVDHGHHAIMTVDAFLQNGGYDESFSHNEDAEFDCRFRANGRRIYLDGDIRLTYHPRTTFRRLFRQYCNYGKGRSRTVRRHPSSLRLRQFAVPSFIGLCTLSLALSPVFPIFLAIPLFYLAALAANAVAIARKRKSLCGLLAAPAAFAMHVGWALGFVIGMLTFRETAWKPGDTKPLPTLLERSSGGETP